MMDQVETQQQSPHVCPHKMAFVLDNWGRRLIQNPKRITGEYIKEGDTVVDIGCGPGFFSIDMARLVGKDGTVVAVDLQEKMLAHVKKKAARKGVLDRMVFHNCATDRIGLRCKADFILAFYMIHETPSPLLFLKEIKGLLKDGGKLLVVEPKFHVNQALFEEMLKDAERAGLTAVDFPAKKGGRSVLLQS